MGTSPSVWLRRAIPCSCTATRSPKGRGPTLGSNASCAQAPQERAWKTSTKGGPEPKPLSRFSRGITPFGLHSSLAVTEKDTVVFSSSANRYA